MRRPLDATIRLPELTTVEEAMEELRQLCLDYLDCLSDMTMEPYQQQMNALLRAGMIGALLPRLHELSYAKEQR